MKNAKLFLILLCVLLFMGTPSVTFGDWNDGDPYKWVQYPDLSPMGIDINGTFPYKLADDFECTITGPLTDFHIWCSWLDDWYGIDPHNVDFIIEIYDDIPASISPTGYSMPGVLLWDWYFAAGDFVAVPYATGEEGWMDPPDMYWWPADWTCWQYNFFVDPENAVRQEGTPDHPVIYWVAIQAMPRDPGTLWGWKTRNWPEHFNDDAVWTDGTQIWQELRYPPGHEFMGESIDLAFVITGEEEEQLDFSDAPEYDPTGLPTSYPTTLINDGARHIIVPGVFLGNLVDPEPDGQPTLPADGDDLDVLYPSMGDDEDGVLFFSPLIPGQPAQIQVTASLPGFLYAWVDFDANFSWAEAGDQIFNGMPLAAGPNILTFNVPNSAAPMTTTYARFRYVTTAMAALSYNGLAPDGDVEDYEVFIEEGEEKLKFQQLPLDGVVIGDIPYYGHDELSTAYRNIDLPEEFVGCYMADDFADLENTPVIRIKWWGSYLENEIMEPINRFLIAFETDVPAETGADPPWSHPGELLLSQFVVLNTTGTPLNPGEYSERLVPSPGSPCEQLYEYEAILENPFPQEPDTVYWIKIVALIEDPLVYDRIMRAMTLPPAYPGTLCEFLNLPWLVQQSYGLEMPVTRWGWHNRDYTKMDPYASTPLAVIPGEHIAGLLSDGTNVWHFQDDAVSGDVKINEATGEMPWVYQPWWNAEYYKWYWELCQPNPFDIDGPPEIEEFSKDLAFELWTETTEPEDLDFSDAPEYDPTGLPTQYPTTLANDGARHIIVPGVFLGNLVDPEPDGQPTLPADGDDLDVLYPSLGDDEDGVLFTSPLIPGQIATVDVIASVPGFLFAWLDFDANFSWAEADNLIFNGQPLNAGLNNLSFNVPNSAAPMTPTYARFRYVTTAVAALSYNGLAQDGDVEDYEVFIEEEEVEKLKFQQLPLDGVVIGDIPYYGHDELSTAYRSIDLPEEFIGCYMADDFADLENTPIIKIKWWGSYLENEIMEPVVRFLIAFETDVPADTGVDPPWSHPGEVIQSQFVILNTTGIPLNPGEYSERLVPSPGSPCEQLYEYEAILENPFPQEPDTVYWLKIVALIEDPLVYDRIIRAMTLPPAYPGTLCEFLNLPWLVQQSYGLEMPVTRWGWHNRDYTKMDPYASTPLAVIPGEHIQGFLFPGTMIETPIWHFQDDAVSGEVTINEATPEMPWVYQPWWNAENYKWYWELCQPPYDIDGPPEIEEFSKDLAFELWTPTECVKPTAAFYSTWALFGKPNCWCYRRNCRGDTDSIYTGLGANKKWVNSIDLAVFNAAYNVIEAPLMGISVGGVPGICADNNRAYSGLGVNKKWVNSVDLGIFNSYYNVVEAGVPECDMTNYYFWTN